MSEPPKLGILKVIQGITLCTDGLFHQLACHLAAIAVVSNHDVHAIEWSSRFHTSHVVVLHAADSLSAEMSATPVTSAGIVITQEAEA